VGPSQNGVVSLGLWIWTVQGKPLNKQAWIAEKGQSFSLGVGRGLSMLRNVRQGLDLERYSGKTDVKEAGWQSVKWIKLAQNGDKWRAIVNTVMNSLVP
jgi:hypothetical protein